MYDWLTWLLAGAAVLAFQTVPNLVGSLGAAWVLRAFRKRGGR